jgi:Protein of unknown function (DUF2628)
MNQYKIFKHPSGKSEAIKLGWSWPAFLFIFIWAIVKKMYLFGFGIFALFFVLGVIFKVIDAGAIGHLITDILSLVNCIVFGIYGNSWLETNLTDRGFDHIDTVTAANPEGALALYLKAEGIAK